MMDRPLRHPQRPRPLSPFLRLLIGALATALTAEFVRFQADLAWAAQPVGAGAVITLAHVARGLQARRRWRSELAAATAAEAAERDVNGDLPVPRGMDGSPLAAAPRTVQARRHDPAPFANAEDDGGAHEPSEREPSALTPAVEPRALAPERPATQHRNRSTSRRIAVGDDEPST